MTPQDEARLNDWIEGVLPPDEAADVVRDLERDPGLARVVRAMQADRVALIAMPEPAVPEDLRAAIDAAVERSLLTPEAPSVDVAAWLSRHRRTPAWLAPRRLAAAAAVLTLVGGGLVTLRLVGGGGSNGGEPLGPDGFVAAADPEPDVRDRRVDALALGPGTDLVHAAPAGAVTAPARSSAPTTGAVASIDGSMDGESGPVPGVRLVVTGPEARAALEARLGALVGPDGSVVSVTRNLTVADLARMDGDGRPLMADLQNARRGSRSDWIDGWSDRARAEFGGGLADGPAERTSGLVVAGDAGSMPPWGEQILFSEVGAAWTLVVPADRLEAVLAELAAMAGGRSQLIGVDAGGWRTLDDAGTWRAMRAALMDAARTAGPGATIRVPVAVASGPTGS